MSVRRQSRQQADDGIVVGIVVGSPGPAVRLASAGIRALVVERMRADGVGAAPGRSIR